MDTFFCPIGVWIREVPLYNAQDTSLIRTLSSCPIGVWIREVPLFYLIKREKDFFHDVHLPELSAAMTRAEKLVEFPRQKRSSCS